MNILQDILGLITKGKVKPPTDKDYMVVAAYTDAQEILKPQPKMQANLINLAALKNYILSSVTPPTPPAYKVYTARVSMGDGFATVFENTLGVTITWTAFPGSISTGTVIGLIGQNNVYVQVSSNVSTSSPKIVSANFAPAPWRVVIDQTDNAGVADSTQSVNVEIRVYN